MGSYLSYQPASLGPLVPRRNKHNNASSRLQNTFAMAPAAKKASGATKAAPKATHPTYQDMITDAIVTLKERNGSSRQSLKKYVKQNNPSITATDNMLDALFNRALKAGVDKGSLSSPRVPLAAPSWPRRSPPPRRSPLLPPIRRRLLRRRRLPPRRSLPRSLLRRRLPHQRRPPRPHKRVLSQSYLDA